MSNDGQPVDAAAAAAELLRRSQTAAEPFGTGYSIDKTCGAIGPGDFVICVARSSVGKSTWYLNIISRTQAVPTVVFNFEMTGFRQMHWLTAITHELYASAYEMEAVLRNPSHPHYEQTRSAVLSMGDYYPYLWLESPQEPMGVAEMVRRCDVIFEQTGVVPQRVIIDHLSLLKGSRDYSAMSTICADLRHWAGQDDINVIALQQGSRSGDGMTKNNGHLPVTLGSGQWAGEQDTDYLFGLYRPALDPKYLDPGKRDGNYDRLKTVTRFQVVKNRPNGRVNLTGLELEYDPKSMKLYERGAPWRSPQPIKEHD